MKEREKDRDKDRDKENGSVRMGATAASPLRERDKEKPKKEIKGKPTSPRAPIVVGVRSAYSVAGVIAAARQLALNTRKAAAVKEVKEGYSTVGPFASPARTPPSVQSTPVTASKQQAARPSEKTDRGSSSTGTGGKAVGAAGRITETLTVHLGSQRSTPKACEERATTANSEYVSCNQPSSSSHVHSSVDGRRSESAESVIREAEAEASSFAQVDFIDLDSSDIAGAKAASEGDRRPAESPRGGRQQSRGLKVKDRDRPRDRREEAKEDSALDASDVSFAMPFPLDLSVEGLRLSQERPSTRRGSPRSSGAHTGVISPVRPRPVDSVRSGSVMGVAATSQKSQKSSNRAATSDTAPMRCNAPSSSSTSHTSSNVLRPSGGVASTHNTVLGVNTAMTDMDTTGYVSTTVSTHSNTGYDISIGDEEKDCKQEQKSRDGLTLGKGQRQGKAMQYGSHRRKTQDNVSICLGDPTRAEVKDGDSAVMRSEGEGALDSRDDGQNDSNDTSSTDDGMGADTDLCSAPSTPYSGSEVSRAQEKEPAGSSSTKYYEEGAARRRMSHDSEKATDDGKDSKGEDGTGRGESREGAEGADEEKEAACSPREEVFVARPPPNKQSSGPSSPRPPVSGSENQFRQNRMRIASASTPPIALPP